MKDLQPPALYFPMPMKSLLLLLSLLLLAVPFVQASRVAGMNYVIAPKVDNRHTFDSLTPEEHTEFREEGDAWVELVLTLTKLFAHLVEPYVAASLPFLPIDWSLVMNNVNQILDKSSIAIEPLRAAMVGTAAMSVPIILEVGRMVVDGMASLLDNTVYSVTGHALGRRSVPSDMTEELADVALRLVHLATRLLGR